MIKRKPTRLTPEQYERFMTPAQRIAAEHYVEIPIIEHRSSTTPAPTLTGGSGIFSNIIAGAEKLVKGAGESVGGWFTGFGSSIQSTIFSLIFLIILVAVLYFLLKWMMCRCNGSSQSCHQPSLFQTRDRRRTSIKENV